MGGRLRLDLLDNRAALVQPHPPALAVGALLRCLHVASEGCGPAVARAAGADGRNFHGEHHSGKLHGLHRGVFLGLDEGLHGLRRRMWCGDAVAGRARFGRIRAEGHLVHRRGHLREAGVDLLFIAFRDTGIDERCGDPVSAAPHRAKLGRVLQNLRGNELWGCLLEHIGGCKRSGDPVPARSRPGYRGDGLLGDGVGDGNALR
mmetsp:Transcript_113296/g.360126  ORF Transcript_113296/g.360126 Transcript_113296/m.360126 type:complete len:204 (-) Transcript_113296:1017-1628(-)